MYGQIRERCYPFHQKAIISNNATMLLLSCCNVVAFGCIVVAIWLR